IETHVSEELVRFAAGEVTAIVEQMGGKQPPLLPGLRIKILDGNCIEATEHRIKELRSISSGALPGKSLVVYDPSLRIPIDVFLCEDGHAQERSMLTRVLESVQKDDCWIADRNFCVVNFLCGIDNAGGYFIIRRHGKLPWKSLGPETAVGVTETGEVYEQPIAVTDNDGQKHKFRQIRIVLKKVTRDGDNELFLITNLPRQKASGAIIAGLYRHRWRIETAFQELKKYLVSEINTMGYPPAALFAFSIALVAYMVVSVLKASLCSVHGIEKIENEVSNYYIADEISGTCRGMMIAIDDSQWEIFSQMTIEEFVAILIMLAKKVNLAKYKKHPRGPKKPSAKRRSDPKVPHVSTARILKKRKKK
ncbi:MAG: transposase, partial [Desulfobacterales bacterium]